MRFKYKRHKVFAGLVQFLFWLASYFILLNVFATSGEIMLIDHIYTSLFIITLLIPVSFNDLVLIPRLLKRNRYLWFVVAAVTVMLITTWFNQMFFGHLVDYVFPGYYFISYYEFNDLLQFFAVFVSAGTLLTLSLEWFKTREDRHRVVALEKAKLNAEFKALSSQINPHFLFNSLTVLYTLSLKDSKETSAAIIKLSDILRYVIYESSSETASLRSEMSILKDYVDLQKYRVHPSTLVEFNEAIESEDVRIAPMLLLPLVENSFKHGVHGDTKDTFVKMSLHEANGIVTFTIVNNKPADVPKSPGIGIKNLNDRLIMMYPGKHKLHVTETADTFKVILQINTAG